ncbi:MAG TPA: helicase C-terminal domain-containing protein [Ignavibacteria bacterium]|nr:helicase C-terminal domain-containing protein [Ignavibacteria bacterium]HMR40067.1 helicase C-terminal domain-containing protein [Ignavibacteria bacterium]
MDRFFSASGILSENFNSFEFRSQQKEMAEKILSTLDSKLHLFIEAPTGIGKSFAYLVPAVYYAKKNQKKVIVSTYTINLQEQLINKDIPFLQNILPVEFKAKILKGRNNYLCPKRLMHAMESSNVLFETEEQVNLEQLYQWSKRTSDGTRSDIDFALNEEVWNSVCSERGICTHKTCGGDNTNCFYQKAKKELADSDVIVVNHHLFFTLFDGISDDKDGYLYRNDFVIFDEAHTVEQVATDHIAPSLSREMVKYHLLKLYNHQKKKGFLLTLPSLHIQATIQNLLDLNTAFFYRLRRSLFESGSDKPQGLTCRIYDKNIEENLMKDEMDNLLKNLRSLRPNCKSEEQENELNEFIIRFSEMNYILDDFLNQKKNDIKDDKNKKRSEFVYWVELSSQKPESNVSICSSPVDISDYFRENIFRPNNSTILTSATLTINNNFEYFKNRLGGESVLESRLDSPFDFYRQVKIYIPKEIPAPSKDMNSIYEEKLSEWINYFIGITKGKALVLFTNSTLMKNIGKQLKENLATDNIELLIQGTGISRSRLLKHFKSDINSVLFGLDSFWMGVDVPGESLSNLIMTRLPFQVPSHPVVQAKMEFIEQKGGNSFYEYSLPEAILKFRQGVGRLIRHNTDQGIIAILDNRIINKSYGKYFLNSIDECEIEIVE